MNIWKITSAVLAVLLVIYIFVNGTSITGFFVKDKNSQGAIDFINENLLTDGMKAELVDVSSESGVYNLKIDINGQEINSYVSKDGKLLFPSAIPLNTEIALPTDTGNTNTPTEVPKTAKPKVEVFIMSHCPYGTQIEKGIIPVVELLKNKIDFNIKFVNYAMHGEKEVKEELNQVCIQNEQNDKFLPYLKCFLKEGNSEACLKEVKVDTTKLTTCTKKVDKEFSVLSNLNDQSKWLSGKYPIFAVDDALNKKYGVQGSPTLIINGVDVSAGRNSATLLEAVCNAFSTEPSECSKELSSTNPSAGFGFDASATTGTSGSCS